MSKFDVKVEEEGIKCKRVYLRVTYNGYQWTSIGIRDVKNEIPLMIEALQNYIKFRKSRKIKQKPIWGRPKSNTLFHYIIERENNKYTTKCGISYSYNPDKMVVRDFVSPYIRYEDCCSKCMEMLNI